MTTQLKENNSSIEISESHPNKKPMATRPNIDHLLKRISQERHKDRKTNLIILFIVILGFAAVSFLLTQA